MKQLKVLILLSIIILNSCNLQSNEELAEPINLDFTNLKIDVEITNTLFTLEEIKLQEKVNNKVAKLLKVAKETLLENKSVTNVIYSLNVENGNVRIENILLVNTNTEKVIKQQKYNSKAIPDLDELFNGGRCPSGYTQLASCSNLGDGTEDCIGGALTEYLSKNLTSVGDCTNINVSVGVLSTRVCGETC